MQSVGSFTKTSKRRFLSYDSQDLNPGLLDSELNSRLRVGVAGVPGSSYKDGEPPGKQCRVETQIGRGYNMGQSVG